MFVEKYHHPLAPQLSFGQHYQNNSIAAQQQEALETRPFSPFTNVDAKCGEKKAALFECQIRV